MLKNWFIAQNNYTSFKGRIWFIPCISIWYDKNTFLETGVVTPTVTKEKRLPTPKVATELLSSALNTRSKNILQEFTLQDSGGFKIGNFKE